MQENLFMRPMRSKLAQPELMTPCGLEPFHGMFEAVVNGIAGNSVEKRACMNVTFSINYETEAGCQYPAVPVGLRLLNKRQQIVEPCQRFTTTQLVCVNPIFPSFFKMALSGFLLRVIARYKMRAIRRKLLNFAFTP